MIINLPKLVHSGRIREYKQFDDKIKSIIFVEHLINARDHRWLDRNVIKRDNTEGRISANILYYLGMKAVYRGLFKDYTVSEVIDYLKTQGQDFAEVVRLLEVYADDSIDTVLTADLEAVDVEEDNEEVINRIEGRMKSYYSRRYERNVRNRKAAIKHHGTTCYGCGFNFEAVYGERGKNFIEIHHIKPLSTIKEEVEIDPINDLIPLCSNCHRIVHRNMNHVLSLDELKSIIRIEKN